jgi:hypothetical protein
MFPALFHRDMQTVSYHRWNPPQSPVRIEFPAELPAEIQSRSFGGGGNGLLFGWCQGRDIRVLAARLWPDSRGLVPPELEPDPALKNLEPLGIFIHRTRGEVFLTARDLELFESRKAQIALVLAGDRAGFFVRQADGSICTILSHEEFSIRPGAAASQRSKPASTPRNHKPPKQVRPRAASSSFPWGWAAALASAFLAVPLAGVAYLVPAPPLGLAVAEREGQLMITWNPRAAFPGSQVQISDGDERTLLPLLPGQSSATYCVRNGDVEITVFGRAGSETARFLTRPMQAIASLKVRRAEAEVAELENQVGRLRQESEEGAIKLNSLKTRLQSLTQ